MRLHLSRTTALVALMAALMAVSGAAPPRQGAPPGRDRDRLLRLTRGGPQRLEAVEGVTHTHDEQDLRPAPPGKTVLVAGSHAEFAQHAPASPAAVLPAPLPALSDPFFRTPSLFVPRQPAPLAAWLRAYAPDRAPPLA